MALSFRVYIALEQDKVVISAKNRETGVRTRFDQPVVVSDVEAENVSVHKALETGLMNVTNAIAGGKI